MTAAGWITTGVVWVLLIALLARVNHVAHRNPMPKPGERGKH